MDKEWKSDSITTWIAKAREGDSRAVEKLWSRYFLRLAEFSSRLLPGYLMQMVDEEDIALSAFHGVLDGFNKGRFEQIRNRDDLWNTLSMIAARKISNHIKSEMRQKRGKRVQCDSVQYQELMRQQAVMKSRREDPAWKVEFADVCRTVFEALPDDRTREIASLRLEGFTVKEIAEQLNLAPRTIERKLSLIRVIWNSIHGKLS